MSGIRSKPAEGSSAAGTALFGLYLASLATCLVGNLLVRLAERGGWLPPWGRVAPGVASAVPLAVAAPLFWRLLRRDLDELLQRVLLEGFAFALTVYLPPAALYVNLKTAGVPMFRLDPPELLLLPALLVVLGVVVAWRRYR